MPTPYDFSSLSLWVPEGDTPLPLPDENEAPPEGVAYGYFSTKQAEKYGTHIYKSEDGKSNVRVSTVSSTPRHGMGWDDLVYVGRVLSGEGGWVSHTKGPGEGGLYPSVGWETPRRVQKELFRVSPTIRASKNNK